MLRINRVINLFEDIANQSILTDKHDKLKLMHFLFLMFIGSICSFLFATYNFIKGDYQIAIAITAFFIVISSSLYFIRKKYDPLIFYIISNLVYLFIMGTFMFSGDEYGARILWAYVYPVGNIFIFGNRQGLLWSLMMFIVVFLTVVSSPYSSDIYTAPFIVRFVATYLVITSIASWLEYYRKNYQDELLNTNQALMEKQKLLEKEIEERVALQNKLTIMAHTDSLTNLMNRRHFWSEANKELERSLRYNLPVCLAVLDIDHFKEVNDTLGHPAGDEVLRILARKSSYVLRGSDLLARIGGEEFAFLLLHVSLDEAHKKLDSFRREIETSNFAILRGKVKFTVSIGVASYDKNSMKSVDDLYKLADLALYRAKEKGRNQVEQA